jgi:hypothetical protein
MTAPTPPFRQAQRVGSTPQSPIYSRGLKFRTSRGNAMPMTITSQKAHAQPPDRSRCSIVGLMIVGLVAVATPATADSCDRAEFETVVTQASETLRDLATEKKPAYQAKLRGLMEKRGWTYDQFVKEAGPLVADEKVTAYDQSSADLLAKINRMGDAGRTDAAPHAGSGTGPDCALLKDLRATMAALVATQTEKWAYLFTKLDAETAR